MRFALNKLLWIALLVTVSSAPIQDVSMTSVDVIESPMNSNGSNQLFVTVTRIDDLLDDDGSLLAERIMSVRVTFDVVDNMLICNSKPVEMGVSNLQIEAEIAANPDKLTINSEEELAILSDSFDVGLVTVEITASIMDEMKTEDGMMFRRISVSETITEVNGYKVVQTEANQQILDVFDNGSLITWSIDPLTGFMLPGMIQTEDVLQSLNANEISVFMTGLNWWGEQSILIQTLLVCSVYVFFLGIALIIQHMSMASQSDYVPIEPPAYIENEEKKTSV